jgi:magnesium transporter
MKLVQKRSRKTGLPPGTLVHIGEERTSKVMITVFNYVGTMATNARACLTRSLYPPIMGLSPG